MNLDEISVALLVWLCQDLGIMVYNNHLVYMLLTLSWLVYSTMWK